MSGRCSLFDCFGWPTPNKDYLIRILWLTILRWWKNWLMHQLPWQRNGRQFFIYFTRRTPNTLRWMRVPAVPCGPYSVSYSQTPGQLFSITVSVILGNTVIYTLWQFPLLLETVLVTLHNSVRTLFKHFRLQCISLSVLLSNSVRHSSSQCQIFLET